MFQSEHIFPGVGRKGEIGRIGEDFREQVFTSTPDAAVFIFFNFLFESASKITKSAVFATKSYIFFFVFTNPFLDKLNIFEAI